VTEHVCRTCPFRRAIKDSDNVLCDGGFSGLVEVGKLAQTIECDMWKEGKKQ